MVEESYHTNEIKKAKFFHFKTNHKFSFVDPKNVLSIPNNRKNIRFCQIEE